MSSTAAKIRNGSLWLAGSRAITNGLGLISTIVMARLLVPADFGVVAIGLTVLTITSAVTDMSLTQALIHHADPDARHLNCAWTLNTLRGALMGLILALSGPVVERFYGDHRLVFVMSMIGLGVFIGGMNNPKLALLKRDLVFWQDFVLQSAGKLSMVAVSIVFAYFYRNYLALIAGFLASQVAQNIVSYLFVPFLPRPRLKEAGQLLSFSWWLTATQIVRTVNFRLDPLIIGKFVGPHDLGLFTVSFNLSSLPTRETTFPLTSTLFPAFRRLTHDPKRLQRAYTRAQTLISAVALPCGILMAVLAEPLIRLAMGAKWLEAVFIVQVLSITIALNTLGTALGALAMANGKNNLIFRRSLQGLMFRLPVTCLGLYVDGLRGLLISRIVLCVAAVVLNKIIVRELIDLPVREQFIDNWRTLVGGLVMGGVGFALSPYFHFGTSFAGLFLQIATLGTLTTSVYLMTLLGLWAITGRPTGPEHDLLDALARVLRRFGMAGRLAGGN